ncbi:hypothetical protein L2E82_12267 [Cichorium intybus]|uniref:Uncharacterized protein n=1 Tax=Cichorium intybus TaxID=13427 RepID=A0ACB9GF28_CICIN|nr:hypothetical protein L2E82_12267 [Cichorium intybus]
MGWKEGEGLGSSRSGIADPIMGGNVKNDNLGVGASQPGAWSGVLQAELEAWTVPLLKEHIANRLASPGQGKELIAKSKNCGTDPRVEVLHSSIAINLSEIVEGVDSYNPEHQPMQALLRG